MSETAPCPWCKDGGKPFGHINRQPFFSVTIKCNSCHSEGPHVKFNPNTRLDWDRTIAEAREEAVKLWNARHVPKSENDKAYEAQMDKLAALQEAENASYWEVMKGTEAVVQKLKQH